MSLRIGICGFGRMGQTRAETVENHPGAEVVLVYDQTYPDHTHYPKAASIEALVTAPEVDAVFVCLPNYLNKSTTILALDAGKHVFCEKPPAFNAGEVEEIIAAERRSGRKLMYGFNHRHHSAVVKMKKLIQAGRYGRVLWMRGRYGKSVDASYLDSWRSRPELAGGGILIDQGIHMLDLFLHLGDATFDDVQASVSSLYWQMPGIEDNVFAILRDSSTGLTCSLHSTMTQWRHLFSLEVFLERGYLVLNGLKTSSDTYGEEVLTIAKNRSRAPAATWEDEERLQFRYDLSWSREAELFLAAVIEDRPVTIGTSAQALAVMTVIDRIYTSERYAAERLHRDLSTVDDPATEPTTDSNRGAG